MLVTRVITSDSIFPLNSDDFVELEDRWSAVTFDFAFTTRPLVVIVSMEIKFSDNARSIVVAFVTSMGAHNSRSPIQVVVRIPAQGERTSDDESQTIHPCGREQPRRIVLTFHCVKRFIRYSKREEKVLLNGKLSIAHLKTRTCPFFRV